MNGEIIKKLGWTMLSARSGYGVTREKEEPMIDENCKSLEMGHSVEDQNREPEFESTSQDGHYCISDEGKNEFNHSIMAEIDHIFDISKKIYSINERIRECRVERSVILKEARSEIQSYERKIQKWFDTYCRKREGGYSSTVRLTLSKTMDDSDEALVSFTFKLKV